MLFSLREGLSEQSGKWVGLVPAGRTVYSTCKGPEVGGPLACLEASVARAGRVG